jgi:uncharacterized protein
VIPSGKITDITVAFVKEVHSGAEGGHDWYHIVRVWEMARYLHRQEEKGDRLTIELASLLHDISDPKFNGGDEEKGSLLAYNFLIKNGLERERTEHIQTIIKHVSFKGGIPQDHVHSIEFQIVQDADRLDAIGAIGIARAFNYGGFKNRPIYDPTLPPQEYEDSDAYRKSRAPTINHFYEKLLKLKELMNTATGKKIAEERHAYMLQFLERFYQECDPGKGDPS